MSAPASISGSAVGPRYTYVQPPVETVVTVAETNPTQLVALADRAQYFVNSFWRDHTVSDLLILSKIASNPENKKILVQYARLWKATEQYPETLTSELVANTSKLLSKLMPDMQRSNAEINSASRWLLNLLSQHFFLEMEFFSMMLAEGGNVLRDLRYVVEIARQHAYLTSKFLFDEIKLEQRGLSLVENGGDIIDGIEVLAKSNIAPSKTALVELNGRVENFIRLVNVYMDEAENSNNFWASKKIVNHMKSVEDKLVTLLFNIGTALNIDDIQRQLAAEDRGTPRFVPRGVTFEAAAPVTPPVPRAAF